MRIKIGLSAICIPLFFFAVNQLILQFLKPADQTMSVRLGYALSPAIFALFFTAAVIIIVVILRMLRPLRLYFSSGEDYERARSASLRIPWVLILANTGLWLVAITLFYALQGFHTEGGVPFFWSLTTNSLSGFVSALIAALLINRILIPSKIELAMTDILPGERDVFVKIKLSLVFISGFLYTILVLCYGARYFHLSAAGGHELIPMGWRTVLLLLSVFAFLPMAAGVFLAVSEDRIQRRYLKEKLDDLMSGKGGLQKKVNLLHFDDTGQIAASINRFIDKIRLLVEKVDEIGRQVFATSRAVEEYVNSLSEETTTMLEAVNQIDEDMGEQENEIRHTGDSLEEYFQAIEKITGNIEEQSASVAQTSSSVEELASSIKSVNRAAREVETLTGNLKTITEAGSGQVEDFIGSIRVIEDSSGHVAEMLDHMKELSNRIDTLAMNAAIEAAHAGDFGKGFAVVADEVKNLAENSSEKTSEIGTHVSRMLSSVRDSNEKTEQTERSFGDIRTNVGEATVHFHNIFRALEEEALGVDELLTTLSALVNITEELKNIAGTQRDGNRDMEESIHHVFDRFKTIRESINGQRRNRQAIADALSGMKEVTAKNLEIAGELETQLREFS